MNRLAKEFLKTLERELTRNQISRSRRKRALGEVTDHLEQSVARLEASGLSAERAWGEALRRFGSPASLAQRWRRAVPPTAPASWTLAWVATTVVGSLLGLMVLKSLGGLVSPLVGMMLVVPLAGVTVGGLMGALQSALRGAASDEGMRWSLASGMAIAVGLTLSTVLIEASGLEKGRVVDDLFALVLIGAATGALLGLSQQWLVPRATFRERTDGVLCSALGGGVGLALGGVLALGLAGDFRSGLGLLLPVALAAALMALPSATPTWPGRLSSE